MLPLKPSVWWKIDDKCALDALSAVEVAGYKILAWRPHCEEAIPFMDHAGALC